MWFWYDVNWCNHDSINRILCRQERGSTISKKHTKNRNMIKVMVKHFTHSALIGGCFVILEHWNSVIVSTFGRIEILNDFRLGFVIYWKWEAIEQGGFSCEVNFVESYHSTKINATIPYICEHFHSHLYIAMDH